MQYLVLNPLNTVDTIYAYIYKCLHKCLPQNIHRSVCEAYAYTLRALKVIEPTLSEIVCVGEQGGGGGHFFASQLQYMGQMNVLDTSNSFELLTGNLTPNQTAALEQC